MFSKNSVCTPIGIIPNRKTLHWIVDFSIHRSGNGAPVDAIRVSGQVTWRCSELFWTSFHALAAEQLRIVETSTVIGFVLIAILQSFAFLLFLGSART